MFVEDEGVGGLEEIAAGAVTGVVVELEEGEEGEGQQGEGAKRHGGGVEVEGDGALVDEARGEVVEGVRLEVLGGALALGAARGLCFSAVTRRNLRPPRWKPRMDAACWKAEEGKVEESWRMLPEARKRRTIDLEIMGNSCPA